MSNNNGKGNGNNYHHNSNGFSDSRVFHKSKSCGESIILLARKKAEMLTSRARAQAEKLKIKAHDEGYKQGLELGRKEGILKGHMEQRDELETLKIRMNQLENQYETQVTSLLENLTPKIREMILNLLENLLKREVKDDNELVIRNIKAAIRGLIQRDKIQLSVNPSEVDEVIRHKEEIISSHEMVEDMEVIASKEVNPGSAIVSSPGGIIDARIESQMEAISEVINN